MVRMARKILSADVTIVALCKRGMNTLRTLYKSEGVRLMAMVKAAPTFEEKGELLAVVAAPGLVDADGDEFTAEAISKSAHAFMRNGATLDLQHNMKPLGKERAHVAESFVIQKGDPRFADWKDYAGKAVDVSGGWGMLVKIEDPALRKSYASGEWDGVSLFAPEFEAEGIAKSDTSATIASALRDAFVAAGLIKTPNETETEESDMTPEQIAALSKAIVDGVTAAIKPATETPAPAADEIKFEGSPTNAADLRKHADKVRAATLLKSGDLNDPAKIEALIKSIEVDPKAEREALRKSNPTLAAALDERDAAEARVKALEKGSNQSAGAGDPPSPATNEAALVKSARDMAAKLNADRGFKTAAAK
jgi:hypothetical protein